MTPASEHIEQHQHPLVGRASFKTIILAVAIAVAIFVFDLLTPLGVAGGVPYVALVLIGIWFPRDKDIVILAAVGSALTVLGYFVSPPGGDHWVVLLNRGLALFAIWAVAIHMVSRFRLKEASMRADEQKNIAHKRLLDAFESVPTMMALYDSEDRFVQCNQEYKKALHKVADMLVPGTSFHDISLSGAQRGMVKGYEDRPEEWVRVRTERLHNPGSPVLHQQQDGRWVLTADHKVADGSTFITRTDVSAVFKAETALREIESRFKKSQDYASIGTWDWNILDGSLFWSEQIMPLFGYEPGSVETTYENFVAAIHPDDRKQVTDAVQDCVENGAEYDVEHRVVWTDGTVRWLHEKGNVERDEDGTPLKMLGVVWDITGRKEAQIAMHLALKQADIANKVKSELMANMSHELRTPLNAIIGFTGSIMAETFGPIGNEKYLEYIDHISSSGQHLLELINDILDVSAIEVGKLELHEDNMVVDDLIESSIQLIKERADLKQIQLHTNLQADLPILYADARRMKQILLNLLSNAVKFTPDEGTVTLSASQNNDGACVFITADTGIGMSDTERTKAMTQFGQVDSSLSRKEEGTGLGLPLTMGLVELHGGTFHMVSEKGVGTTVTVTLPPERMVS